MTKIRKLYYFDKKNAKEMISFLNNGDTYTNKIMFNPLAPLHGIVPLRYKFIPESYVLKDGKEIKGLITIAPTRAPQNRVEILKLLFEENSYDVAGELVQYAVAKYKAKGCSSIIVRIDDYLPELLKLFVSKCGFTQISYEKLWKIDDNQITSLQRTDNSITKFREFRNSDAQVVSTMYNEQLLPHFRPLLRKESKEFKDFIFAGLADYSEYKYIYLDNNSKNVLACLTITTTDNENYVLDIIQSSWEELDLNSILVFAYDKVKQRKSNAKFFVKSKKYTPQGIKYENNFMEHKFECVQNKIVLTNSSVRIVNDEKFSGKFTVLNQFYGGIGVVNKI